MKQCSPCRAWQIQKAPNYKTWERLNFMQIFSDAERVTAKWETITIILTPAETEGEDCLLPQSTTWKNFKQNGKKADCYSLWFPSSLQNVFHKLPGQKKTRTEENKLPPLWVCHTLQNDGPESWDTRYRMLLCIRMCERTMTLNRTRG